VLFRSPTTERAMVPDQSLVFYFKWRETFKD